jgi:hypothetical protein
VVDRSQEGIMSKSRKLAVSVASAVAAAMLFGTSAYAETRHRNETRRDRDRDRGSSSRGYRDNDRVTLEGRIRSIDRHRDAYRVQLDRGAYSFWVPQHALRNRARDFRVGSAIRFGGVFRGGYVHVDVVDWPRGGYYDDRYGSHRSTVRGYVDRVDYRRGTLRLRDDYNGRYVTVDIDRRSRRRSVDLHDLRRGDYVTISGTWLGSGVFEATRIQNVRSRRY